MLTIINKIYNSQRKPLDCGMNKSSLQANFMKLNNLCLSRSKQLILNNLNVEFPINGVTALLGANGAGKSTLLSVLAGISQHDSGDFDRCGINDVFLLPEPAAFYPHLTVKEQLSFVTESFNPNDHDDIVNEAMTMWQLDGVSKKMTQHLSLGYRQRLSLAQLTVSNADLLLFDEPMNGMDPELMMAFKSQINLWKKSKSIIMATHIMHEAQEFADWVVVMNQGQIIYSAAYDNDCDFHDIYQQAMQFQAKDHDETLKS